MPKSKNDKNNIATLVNFESTKDPLAEAFRMLRLQVEMSMDGESARGTAIMITSALQSEGKTMVSCNLAQICAIAKIPTLLIDCDLRKPMVHRVFDIPRSPGITDFLLEDLPESIPIVPTQVSHLSIIPSGKTIKHTTEMLSSPSFTRFLETMRRQFKLIIIDSSPAGIVADSGVIAKRVDAIFLVVRSGSTNSRTVEKTVRTLRDLGGNVKGVILSRIDARRDKYYYYHHYPHYYSKYYLDEDAKTKTDQQ
jgi:capsular exopolysaccharide synthesis family protein